jgi:Tol biopolymer transport system component
MIRAAATPIPVGARIGPYQILGWLGAGGMGDVYRARDARLARDVAIKVIPAALATDASRVRRFEQEARAAGQLNHPNILAVHDVGVHEGAPYIVSELLEGESLRSRLRGGALPSRKAVDYARQIAEGLGAAHDKNIVHRDVKPDNIFITTDGRIKILDFGIAKLTRSNDEMPQDGALAAETEAGMVVGTAAYMSPEQVRGGPVDPRSDLFSLGTILSEMLTGRPPFTRETAAETMTAILNQEAPPSLPDVSPALARIVARCLEKTREMRFQSARDLAFGLEMLSGTGGAAAAPAPAPGALRARGLRRALPWVVAGVLALGLAGALAWNLRRPVPILPVTRFALTLPDGQLLNGNGGGHSLALSPDGERLAYLATRLYLRTMSEGDVKAMPGTERYSGVREPVFSPDGLSIAFYAVADQTLKRATVKGDTVTTICQADSPTGISWGADGIVFGQGRRGIMRVSADGGTPEVLVRVSDGEAQAPQILPGGQQVLFTLATGTARDRSDRAHIVVQSLKSGERKTLIEGGSDARYVPTGHLVYALSGSLYAVPFDAERLVVKGAPIPIVEGVSRDTAGVTGTGNFAFSNTGSLVYVRGPVSASALLDIGLMDRQGKVEPLKLPPGSYEWPRVSPDGKRLAVASDDDKEATVWIYDLSGTHAMQRLTSEGNNRFPVWSSDSTRVAFQSDRDGDAAIFWQPADGGIAERLTRPAPGESHAPESWSPKGDTFLFSITKGSDVSLWTFSLHDRKATPFGGVHSSNPTNAAFSPDGKWVAYASAERGKGTIYVQPFPATGIKYPLFVKGSDSPHHPRWSPDGRELYYDANPKVTGFEAVSVTTQPTFAFGNAVTVPKLFLMAGAVLRTPYDIAPNGRLVGRITAGRMEYVRSQNDQIQVVLNWFEDLKARVPTR